MQKRVNFVVTDLDDTIWDWLTMWHNSFEPFLQAISTELGIKIDDLKSDFKQLHQKYGTTESSFIVEELKLLNAQQREKIYEEVADNKSILHRFYSNKKHNLKLYDGVLKTLVQIKGKGALLIGFTESHSFYTKYRLKTLDLDGIFDCIYAPIDKGIPDTVKKFYPEGYWEPQKTEFRYLSREVRKPNSEILEIILKDYSARKENTIYIGDKLDRDVYMAQEAGITSIYAEYGHKITGAEYDLLKEVTHWTDEDVEREISFRTDFANKKIVPDITLKNDFGEIQNLFDFFAFERTEQKENLKHVVEIWKKVIDVQQHFNDLELRIRNYAITVVGALIAAIAILEREKVLFHFYNQTIPASSILSLAGVFILLAFFYMDRYWYHKLLLGAVKHGANIERQYLNILPELGLTTAVGESSPHVLFKKSRWAKVTIRSSNKFWIFYLMLFIPMLLLTIALFVSHNDRQSTHSVPSVHQTTTKKPKIDIDSTRL